MPPSDRSILSIREDKSVPGGGHAVITVAGVTAPPADTGFFVRRIGYDQDNLGPEGWQGPEARLQPLSIRQGKDGLELRVGPAVVDRIVVGTPVEIEIPALGIRSTLHWPDIAPSVGGPDGARRRVVGTGRGRRAAPPTVPLPPLVIEEAAPPEPPPVPEPPPSPPPPPPAEDPDEKTVPFAPRPLIAEKVEEPPPAPPEAPEKRRDLAAWLIGIGAVLLVLLIAATAWVLLEENGVRLPWLTRIDETPRPSEPQPPEAQPQPAQPEPPPQQPLPPPEPPVPQQPVEVQPTPQQPPQQPAEVQPPPATPAATPPVTPSPADRLETIRRLRDSGLPPAELMRRGEDYLRQGQPDMALLLFEVAGDRNYGPALTAIGRMYDPVHFGEGHSAFDRPNPSMAASWYRRARELGDPGAGPALAALRQWLSNAAARGDPEAAQALRDWF